MGLVLADRIQETTTTSGTGTLTLAGASVGYKTFSSAIGNGNTTYYVIFDQTANVWEVGLGTVGAGTLTRDTVYSNSSGTTAKISFAGNPSNVWCDYPATQSVYKDSLNDATAPQMVASNGLLVNSQTVSASYTIASGNNAVSAGPVSVASGITVTVSSGSTWVVV
jgi:hypothetical protein